MRALRCSCWGVLAAALPSVAAVSVGVDDLFDLDVNQLMQIQVDSAATITPTAERRMPASITTIDRTMIVDSGARSMFDLLEVYVPSFHYLPHHYEAPHMGMRGIIGDRDDKYLIVVNGRVLNERTHYGALSERDLPTLGDIKRIDVIRGPGSVVYGPGAVSMVISIQTEGFKDHSADEATVKWGFVEEFESLELKKSIAFGEQHGLLLYAGIADYDGASNSDAPLVYGLSGTTTWGQQVNAGEDVPFEVSNNHAAYRGHPKLKLHADYQFKDFHAWLRYTRGGEKLTWEHKAFYTAPDGFAADGTSYDQLAGQSVGYQQLVLDLSQKWVLGDNLWLELKGGYDTFDYERILFNNNDMSNPPENHREEQYFARTTLSWSPSNSQSMAAGVEYTYARWGLDSPGFPDAPAISFTLGEMEPWQTSSVGVFAEHQWQITSQLTNFIGLRFDQDQYTDPMWSPRWALVYTPTDSDTIKGIVSRSVRKNNAEELRKQHLADQKSDPEMLEGVELIYERNLATDLNLQLSGYYNDVEVIGIDTVDLRSKPVADFTYGGIELGVTYHTAPLEIYFSHAYTKLNDFNVEPGASQKISVAHLGYGNDLSNWSNHMTKLAAAWSFAPDWRLTGDLRYFWGYPGAQDVTDQTNDARAESTTGRSSSTALSDPGYDDSFQEAIFVDLGLTYTLPTKGTLGLQGYNLMGLFDDKYNKRMYLINVQNYRSEAPSMALTFRQPF